MCASLDNRSDLAIINSEYENELVKGGSKFNCAICMYNEDYQYSFNIV